MSMATAVGHREDGRSTFLRNIVIHIYFTAPQSKEDHQMISQAENWKQIGGVLCIALERVFDSAFCG